MNLYLDWKSEIMSEMNINHLWTKIETPEGNKYILPGKHFITIGFEMVYLPLLFTFIPRNIQKGIPAMLMIESVMSDDVLEDLYGINFPTIRTYYPSVGDFYRLFYQLQPRDIISNIVTVTNTYFYDLPRK